MNMKRQVFLLILFFGIGMPVLSVHAEGGKGLSISPMFQEITLGSNENEKTFVVSISNTTDSMMTLRLSVLDFGSLDESGGVAFLGASHDLGKKYTLASFVRPEKDVVTLASQESQKVRITIENRDLLSPGGHYAALMLKAGDDTDVSDGTNEVAINQLFSVLVFVKKVGGEIYDLKLSSEEYRRNIMMLPETIKLRFQNAGNVHVIPRGIVTITDPLGRVVKKGIINTESGITMPETFRVYPLTLSMLDRAFVPGRYTLDIAYRYDGKDDFTVETVTFDFIPMPATLVLLVVATSIGWYGLRRRRNTGEKKALSSSDKAKSTGV